MILLSFFSCFYKFCLIRSTFSTLDHSTEHAALRRGLFLIGAVIDLYTESNKSPGEADGGETALGCYPRKEDDDASAESGDELEVTSMSV